MMEETIVNLGKKVFSTNGKVKKKNCHHQNIYENFREITSHNKIVPKAGQDACMI